MVGVKMQVAESVDKCARLQAADLGDHEREQGIGSDVERHAQEQVGTALVKLAAQLSFLHEELEQSVARGKGHLFHLPDVPRADDEAAAVRVRLDLFDN